MDTILSTSNQKGGAQGDGDRGEEEPEELGGPKPGVRSDGGVLPGNGFWVPAEGEALLPVGLDERVEGVRQGVCLGVRERVDHRRGPLLRDSLRLLDRRGAERVVRRQLPGHVERVGVGPDGDDGRDHHDRPLGVLLVPARDAVYVVVVPRLQRLPKLVEVLARLAEEGLEGAPQRRLGGGMEPAICLAPVLGEMPITAPNTTNGCFLRPLPPYGAPPWVRSRESQSTWGALPHSPGLEAHPGRT